METEGERMSDKESERSVLEPFSSAEALNCLRRPHWPSVLHTHTYTHTHAHTQSDTAQLVAEHKQQTHIDTRKHTLSQFSPVWCAATV